MPEKHKIIYRQKKTEEDKELTRITEAMGRHIKDYYFSRGRLCALLLLYPIFINCIRSLTCSTKINPTKDDKKILSWDDKNSESLKKVEQ